MKKDLRSTRSILGVADEGDLLDLIEKKLSPHFRSVLTAKSGVEALDILKRNAIDMIVTDYMMPEMNGIELIEKIRASYPLAQVIMLTGNGHNPEILQALKYGAFDIIDKPYRSEVLISRMQNSLLLPLVVQILWAAVGRKMPTPKIEDFLTQPYHQQLKELRSFSENLLARGLIKNIPEGD